MCVCVCVWGSGWHARAMSTSTAFCHLVPLARTGQFFESGNLLHHSRLGRGRSRNISAEPQSGLYKRPASA